MKVVIVSSYNIGNETGTAKVSERLIKQLSTSDQVLYLCLGKTYKLHNVSQNLSYLEIPSVVVSGLWIPAITLKVKKKVFVDLTNFSPDIVHSQNIVFPGLLALLWAKENSVPFVLTFHSLPSEGISYVFPKLKKGKIMSVVNHSLSSGYMKKYLSYTNKVIALNEAVVKSVKKINANTKIKIIRNGLELKPFYDLKQAPPKKTINFVFLGSYTGRKNQGFLIKSFKYLPKNYKLDLYGNLKSGRLYVKKLKRLIKKDNIKNVKINGFLSQRKVYEAYEKANYFLSASLKEVQSLVIIEALASGLPVIGLENETIKELIDNKNGLTINSKTPKSFATKLTTYVKETNENYEEVSKYCRKSVRKFDISLVSKKIIRTYRDVINDTSSLNLKRNSEYFNKISTLLPKQIKDLLDERVTGKLHKSKPNRLKIMLSVTFLVSFIISIIAFISSIIRKDKSDT